MQFNLKPYNVHLSKFQSYQISRNLQLWAKNLFLCYQTISKTDSISTIIFLSIIFATMFQSFYVYISSGTMLYHGNKIHEKIVDQSHISSRRVLNDSIPSPWGSLCHSFPVPIAVLLGLWDADCKIMT